MPNADVWKKREGLYWLYVKLKEKNVLRNFLNQAWGTCLNALAYKHYEEKK